MPLDRPHQHPERLLELDQRRVRAIDRARGAPRPPSLRADACFERGRCGEVDLTGDGHPGHAAAKVRSRQLELHPRLGDYPLDSSEHILRHFLRARHSACLDAEAEAGSSTSAGGFCGKPQRRRGRSRDQRAGGPPRRRHARRPADPPDTDDVPPAADRRRSRGPDPRSGVRLSPGGTIATTSTAPSTIWARGSCWSVRAVNSYLAGGVSHARSHLGGAGGEGRTRSSISAATSSVSRRVAGRSSPAGSGWVDRSGRAREQQRRPDPGRLPTASTSSG